MVVKASRGPSRLSSHHPKAARAQLCYGREDAKTSECKHGGWLHYLSTTAAGSRHHYHYLFPGPLQDKRHSATAPAASHRLLPSAQFIIALRWPDPSFRLPSTSHVCRPTLAAASSLQSLSVAVKHQRCIFRHVFAFPHLQDASCERDQLRAGHRGEHHNKAPNNAPQSAC